MISQPGDKAQSNKISQEKFILLNNPRQKRSGHQRNMLNTNFVQMKTSGYLQGGDGDPTAISSNVKDN